MLVVVVGLAAEAKVARALDLEVICAGGVPARTAAAVEKAIANGATRLLSFGIAGGLAPGLPPGTLISASAVRDDEGTIEVVPSISERIAGTTGARIGLVHSGTAILATVAEKDHLHRATGALAVDMESHVVARAAQRAGLPFAVLRAVADPAGRGLPPAALIPLTPDGRPDLRHVLAAVARRPGQIPTLCRTALDARAALRALFRGGRALRAAGLLGADAGERLLDVL